VASCKIARFSCVLYRLADDIASKGRAWDSNSPIDDARDLPRPLRFRRACSKYAQREHRSEHEGRTYWRMGPAAFNPAVTADCLKQQINQQQSRAPPS